MSATLPPPDDRFPEDRVRAVHEHADQGRPYQNPNGGQRANSQHDAAEAEKKNKILWAIISLLVITLIIVLIVWLTDAEDSVTGFITPAFASLTGT